MNKSQSEITSDISEYLRQPEYYISMLLARFAFQDFKGSYYSTEDMNKFIQLVFNLDPNKDAYKVPEYKSSRVKFYKSVYVPAKDDEKLTEEELEKVKAKLHERDTRVAAKVIDNMELIARILSACPETMSDGKSTRGVSAISFARTVLRVMRESIKDDLDVTPEGRQQLERIKQILEGKEI
jgi:signal transduction histidine kinase